MRTVRKTFGERFGKRAMSCMAYLLLLTLCFPAPLAGVAASGETPENAHVLRRLNSPERQAAIADAAAREASPRALSSSTLQDGGRGDSTLLRNSGSEQRPLATGGVADASRPKSVTEVLFNHAAGFIGVPGLAPRPGLNGGVDGSLDEGLGFHQDGTVRKAGGATGASGPSDNGRRARTYMQSGLQNGYGINGHGGYGPGLSHIGQGDSLGFGWWRGDSTRGGRVSGSGAYSRDMNDLDPMSMILDRGLNYSAGLLNSAGEAALSGLVDGGRARLNFRMDRDGHFNGEGDALLPFYDSARTTIYTQFGARSMHDSNDTRWIGNFGLGQRWFPFAQGEDPKSGNYDAGKLMLGYNAFFDYDFTRDHQRGGLGVEAWYDWLHLSSNYYFPLSNWKGSEDFDSRFVKERPAEGWDARVKAYLPFYRHVALTGAYSQWYGDHVGTFGAQRLEKDPKVWSYGVEYTPIPLVSGFVTQRSTERGRTDTEFGLNFTYHFQMPWEDQISHSKVAELRTVGGSRHDFVDRENRIILEYKTKSAYQVEYLGQSGFNTFVFRVRDGFDTFKAGQAIRVTVSGGTLAAAPAPERSFFASLGGAIVDLFSISTAHAADFSQTYISDRNGEFTVRVTPSASGPVVLSVEAGSHAQDFTVNAIKEINITTESLPPARLSVVYNQTITADGGTPPYSFSATGTLPTGLTLSSGGVLSGTPTATGVFNFTVKVTDSAGTTADKQFSLTVGAAPTYILTQTPVVSIAVGQTVNSVPFVLTVDGSPVADGTSVSLSYSDSGGAFANTSSTATVSGGNGGFTIPLTGRTAGSVTITATFDGGKTASYVFTVALPTYSIAFDSASYSPDFSGNGPTSKASQSVIVTVLNASAGNTPVPNAAVSFSATMATSNQAVINSRKTQFYGLRVNSVAGGDTFNFSSATTGADGRVTLTLEDLVGERVLTLNASVTPAGATTAVSALTRVSFGLGPLSLFRLPMVGSGVVLAQWANGVPINRASSVPAAALCGANIPSSTFNTWVRSNYSNQTNLPTVEQLQTVLGSLDPNANAWVSAGWRGDTLYWTGELSSTSYARSVNPQIRSIVDDSMIDNRAVVCLRR